MTWGMVAIGGATLVGGVLGANASKSAANTAARGTDASIAEQRRQYDLTRADQMPWMQAGSSALNRLQDPNAFQTSPGYQFRLSEGQRGVEQTAAARGGATSGNALKALADYNQGTASSEYGNWWNQQAGLAGVGQAATNAVSAAGANSTNNIGNALMYGADARASGIIGGANSIVGSINSGIGNYLTYKYGGVPKDPNTGLTFNGGFAYNLPGAKR